MVNKNIFRAYDIRGIVPSELNAETAYLIGRAFAKYLKVKFNLKAPKVVVGMDNRTHSPELHKTFVDALLKSGCYITDIGVSPTPYLYFANTYGEFDGGCNITASHNPKQYNGLKLIAKHAHALFGDEIQKIYQMIEAEDFTDGEGSFTNKDFYNDYLAKIRAVFGEVKPLKVVVDSGNGVTGDLYVRALKDLGHDVVELYTELDGTFPNHEADPVVEAHYDDLKSKVIDVGADVGLAFDGDGDRLGVVDENGTYMHADKLLMLFIKDAFSRNSGKSVVATVATGQVVFDYIKKLGGKPVMCPVGHSYVEDSMSKNNAVLGGEQSGHFFLPEDYYSYDDALIAACRILKIIGESNETASGVFSEFPSTVSVPEMRIPCPDDKKFDIVKQIVEHFKNKYPSETMDGIRIDFGNGGWAGIRASNTSPVLSVIMEAQTKDELEAIKSQVLGHLKTYSEIELK